VHRLQGRTDRPLSPSGRAVVGGMRLPRELTGYRWVSSPLRRAVATAQLLGADGCAIEPRLIEMDWGRWEGCRLEDMRRDLGPAMAANEARGLDFRPDGGESPREVQVRLQPWLAGLAVQAQPTIAVTHKGVIRALLAMATGWDMVGKPPLKLDWAAVHMFAVGSGGELGIDRLNVGLNGQ